MRPHPAATFGKCMVKMQLPIEHAVGGFENLETETEVVKINHGMNVHQCFPKRISTKTYEIARIEP